MKIPFPNLGGSSLKSPEMTRKAPALSELEKFMIRTVMAETDASVTDGGVAIARHRRLPHVQAVQKNVAERAIKNAPEVVHTTVPQEPTPSDGKADLAFEYIGFPAPGAQPAEASVADAEVVDLAAVRARVAAQFSSGDPQNGVRDVQEAA